MAIKGAEGKKGVVYLSVDSSMKENNGQQLKVSGFESSWIYQRTFAESDAEGHHSWVSRLEQQCTHLSFHWCENITHVKLLCICTRGLKVIQFQILFSLLLRKKNEIYQKIWVEAFKAVNLFTLLFSVIKMIEDDKRLWQGRYFNA